VGEPLLGFEHAVFLLSSLARGEELTCGSCDDCHALLVIDRYSLRTSRCELCAESSTAVHAVQAARADDPSRASGLPGP
jgi:hypothetical protein